MHTGTRPMPPVRAPVKTIKWRPRMTMAEQNVVVRSGTDVVFEWDYSHNDVYMFPSVTAYNKCDFSQATLLSSESGFRFSTKSKSGMFYFGCQVYSHCNEGQKLRLAVTGG